MTSSPTYDSLEVGDSHRLTGKGFISYRYLDSAPSVLTDLMGQIERHQLGVQHSQVPYVRDLALHNGLSRSCVINDKDGSFGNHKTSVHIRIFVITTRAYIEFFSTVGFLYFSTFRTLLGSLERIDFLHS